LTGRPFPGLLRTPSINTLPQEEEEIHMMAGVVVVVVGVGGTVPVLEIPDRRSCIVDIILA